MMLDTTILGWSATLQMAFTQCVRGNDFSNDTVACMKMVGDAVVLAISIEERKECYCDFPGAVGAALRTSRYAVQRVRALLDEMDAVDQAGRRTIAEQAWSEYSAMMADHVEVLEKELLRRIANRGK